MMDTTKRKREKYLAFLDAEYTCYMEPEKGFDRGHSSEVLSVGLLLCNQDYDVVETYYSPIRPLYNPKLTGYCKSLTGLTQKEIDRAPSYEEVFEKMYGLCTRYPVKEIYTWGNDERTLSDDAERNHRQVPRKYKKMIHSVTDLTRRVTQKVFGKPIVVSLSDMKYVCDMDHVTSHNAYRDAEDLYLVARTVARGEYNKERAKALTEFIHERDVYHRYRRFKHVSLQPSGKVSRRELKQMSAKYMAMLREYYVTPGGKIPPEVLAFCDDVRGLSGQDGQDCPKLPSR